MAAPTKDMKYTAKSPYRYDKSQPDGKRNIYDCPVETVRVDEVTFDNGNVVMQVTLKKGDLYWTANLYPPDAASDPKLTPEQRAKVREAAEREKQRILSQQ